MYLNRYPAIDPNKQYKRFIIPVGDVLITYHRKLAFLIDYRNEIATGVSFPREYSDLCLAHIDTLINNSVYLFEETNVGPDIDALNKIRSINPLPFIFISTLDTYILHPELKIQLEASWRELAMGLFFAFKRNKDVLDHLFDYWIERLLDDGIVVSN